ncbi:MAG: phosphotransferase family protein [Novosphingobium sp.]
MSDVIVAPETRDLDELASALSRWLDGKLGVSGVSMSDLAYPRGAGQSHETILFSATWQGGALEGVVRIKPGGFTVFPDDLFEEQYHVMKALHAAGNVCIAEPLWLEPDPAVLGRSFFVMRKAVGRVPVSVPPYSESGWVFEASPAQRRVLWEDGVRQLAAIQLADPADFPFLAGPDHAPDGLAQEWDKYRRFIAWLDETPASRPFCRVLERGMARLAETMPVDAPAGLVWGDARLGNMMFGDDFRVVAVMDWEQPSLGGALNDLAWFVTMAENWHRRPGRPWFEGMGTREETIALWQQVCGKSAAHLPWFEEFTKIKTTCTGLRLDQLRGTSTYNEEALAKRLGVD